MLFSFLPSGDWRAYIIDIIIHDRSFARERERDAFFYLFADKKNIAAIKVGGPLHSVSRRSGLLRFLTLNSPIPFVLSFALKATLLYATSRRISSPSRVLSLSLCSTLPVFHPLRLYCSQCLDLDVELHCRIAADIEEYRILPANRQMAASCSSSFDLLQLVTIYFQS